MHIFAPRVWSAMHLENGRPCFHAYGAHVSCLGQHLAILPSDAWSHPSRHLRGGGARYGHSLPEMPIIEDRGSAKRKEVQRAAEGLLETTGTPIPVWIVITTSMIRYSPGSARIFESWG